MEQPEKILKDKYNCDLAGAFVYNSSYILKAIEYIDEKINYRYFILTKENVEEIKDEDFLKSLQKKYEKTSSIIL